MMHRGRVSLVLLAVASALLAGCRSAPAPRMPRLVGQEVLGALTPAGLREVYRTPAAVVRSIEGTKHIAVQDADLAADSLVDDTNLLVFVEGAGDTVEGFRSTARLVAESPYTFPGGNGRLVVVLLKWSESTNVVAEHMNRAAQQAGAAALVDMLEVHRLRHGSDGHISLIGFSAGTRVIEMAFQGAAAQGEEPSDPGSAEAKPGGPARLAVARPRGLSNSPELGMAKPDGPRARPRAEPGWHAEALAQVANVVFLGSSIGSEESMPLAGIRGRFLNFVNPRDTHFGDRAAYVAPAGGSADPLKLLQQATIQRRPRFGASVAGFLDLPTLTAIGQFDAVESLERSAGAEVAGRAFKRVNVPVPPTLMAFNLFGDPLPNDDLDDYLNQAPNHYILVGRGPSGRTDVVDFRQYRPAAEEFVREFVAAAALRGRIDRFDLKSVSQGANPFGVPFIVPWAIFGSSPPAAEPEKSAEPAVPPSPPKAGEPSP